MLDSRARPALLGAVITGIAVFGVLWWLGVQPVLAWVAAWSIPAFALYGIDKRRARTGGWRVPEPLLHGLALIGGVAGAWAGRYVFRHKTQKPMFTLVLVIASFLWALLAAWAMLR